MWISAVFLVILQIVSAKYEATGRSKYRSLFFYVPKKQANQREWSKVVSKSLFKLARERLKKIKQDKLKKKRSSLMKQEDGQMSDFKNDFYDVSTEIPITITTNTEQYLHIKPKFEKVTVTSSSDNSQKLISVNNAKYATTDKKENDVTIISSNTTLDIPHIRSKTEDTANITKDSNTCTNLTKTEYAKSDNTSNSKNTMEKAMNKSVEFLNFTTISSNTTVDIPDIKSKTKGNANITETLEKKSSNDLLLNRANDKKSEIISESKDETINGNDFITEIPTDIMVKVKYDMKLEQGPPPTVGYDTNMTNESVTQRSVTKKLSIIDNKNL